MAAQFEVEVLDWDQLGQNETLGKAAINLADLEPFQATERTLSIVHPKHNKGEIKIRMVFSPEIVARTRKNTSTFSVAGRAMTQVGGLPLGATKGLVQGVGGVASGIGGAGSKARGLFKKDKTAAGDDVDDGRELPSVPELLATEAAAPAAASAANALNGSRTIFPTNAAVAATSAPPSAFVIPPAEPGTLRVTAISAKDIVGSKPGDPVSPYLVLTVGGKDHKTKHASKTPAPEWYDLLRPCILPYALTSVCY